LSIELSGPATATPGAPNDYSVRVKDASGQARRARIDAQVKDDSGRTLFSRQFETDGTGGAQKGPPRKELTLPASLWAEVKPGRELALSIAATDLATNDRVELAERVRLLRPAYTTYLTTDRPMDRPGEIIYFRSLTLDRALLLPPDLAPTLRFELRGPNGLPVPKVDPVVGLAEPADKLGSLLDGPGGRPIR